MSNERLGDLLPAIEMAAFERRHDGSFSPVAPLPAWFARLVADATFPFLGHILEEANQFWATGVAARREWGPCAEVDETGREFHYRVTAATVAGAHYLIFQLDAGSDEMRQVLQKVRAQMLVAEQSRSTGSGSPPAAPVGAAFGGHQTTDSIDGPAMALQEIRRIATELRAIVGRLLKATSAESRVDLSQSLTATCDDLERTLDRLAGPPTRESARPQR